jgi:hypothetical protein
MKTWKSFAGLFGFICLMGGAGAAGAFAQDRVETCSIMYNSPDAAKSALATMKDKIASAGYTLIDSWTGEPNMGWTTNYAHFSNGAGKAGYSCQLYALDCFSADGAVAKAKETSAKLTALGFIVIDSTFDKMGTCGITYLAPGSSAAPSAAGLAVEDAAKRIKAASQISIP